MARLLRAIEQRSPEGDIQLVVSYIVGRDVRYFKLEQSEMEGLTAEEVRALAQQRADADVGHPGQQPDLGDDVVPALRNLPGWSCWDAPEAEFWVRNNVIDLPSAREVLVELARIITYLRDMIIER